MSNSRDSKEVISIRLYVFPLVPILIIAALAFLGDRSMEYALIQREATLTVIIVCILALLVFVLLIFLNHRRKNGKGGGPKPDEQI
jgi:hypothetical protein